MVACAKHTWTLISTERGGGIWTVKVECIRIHDAVIVVVIIVMVVALPLTSIIFLKLDECLIATPLEFDGDPSPNKALGSCRSLRSVIAVRIHPPLRKVQEYPPSASSNIFVVVVVIIVHRHPSSRPARRGLGTGVYLSDIILALGSPPLSGHCLGRRPRISGASAVA